MIKKISLVLLLSTINTISIPSLPKPSDQKIKEPILNIKEPILNNDVINLTVDDPNMYKLDFETNEFNEGQKNLKNEPNFKSISPLEADKEMQDLLFKNKEIKKIKNKEPEIEIEIISEEEINNKFYETLLKNNEVMRKYINYVKNNEKIKNKFYNYLIIDNEKIKVSGYIDNKKLKQGTWSYYNKDGYLEEYGEYLNDKKINNWLEVKKLDTTNKKYKEIKIIRDYNKDKENIIMVSTVFNNDFLVNDWILYKPFIKKFIKDKITDDKILVKLNIKNNKFKIVSAKKFKSKERLKIIKNKNIFVSDDVKDLILKENTKNELRDRVFFFHKF
jgi:hypothetical protein